MLQVGLQGDRWTPRGACIETYPIHALWLHLVF